MKQFDLTPAQIRLLTAAWHNQGQLLLVETDEGPVILGRATEDRFQRQEYVTALYDLEEIGLLRLADSKLYRLTMEGRRLAAELEKSQGVEAGEPQEKRGGVAMAMEFDARRIGHLEELLQIEYEKLHELEKELAITSSAAQKFELRQRIKREVLPQLRKHETEYAELLVQGADAGTLPRDEAEALVTDLAQAAEGLEAATGDGWPDEMLRLLKDLREKLDEPGKAAAAKLKVALPIIPQIVSYEMELDVESFMAQVWHRVRDFFSKRVRGRPQ